VWDWRACAESELTTITQVLTNDWAIRSGVTDDALYQAFMRMG
jgi:hypothetical protein